MQEPSACVSEQVTLQLVPWSCALDDSHRHATLTCTPAYLQLSTVPGMPDTFQNIKIYSTSHRELVTYVKII